MLDVLFERFFFRAVEREAIERELTDEPFEGGEGLDLDALREAHPRGDPRAATTASCATSRAWRSPPSAARARAPA